MSTLSNYSDEELQQALRRKRQASLADIPTEQLQAALAAKKPDRHIHERAWDAVRGNAAETLPSVYGSAFTAQNEKAGTSAFGPAMAALFGDDQDVAKALQRDHPDARMTQDENGNPVMEMPDGQRFYVNQPGLDLADAGRFAGKVMQFIPAGRVASLPLTLGGRMVAGAAASGATDLAGQMIAGRKPHEIDLTQTGATTALGAGAELIMPAVNAAGRAIRGAFTNPAQELQAGRSLAQQLGLTDVSDDAARALLRRQSDIAAGADPRAIVAEAEFGYRLTRGQLTGDESLLRREELLRATNPNGPLGLLEKANAEATRQNVGRFREMAARGATPETYEQDAAQRLREALTSTRDSADEAVKAAYSKVPSKTAYAGIDDVGDLPARLNEALRQGDVALTEGLTPNTLTAKRVLDQAVAAAEGAPLRMDRLMDLRRIVGRLGADAKREDSRAYAVLMKEFDGWFDQSLTRSLMEGGDDAVRPFREATASARDYFRKFDDSKSESGKAIIKMLSEEATPEQVANVLLNAQGINKPGAAAIAKRYIDTVGKDSDGVTALREIIAMRLFEKAGDTKSNTAILSALKDATEGRGRSLMTTVFNRTELTMLQRFASTLDDFLVPKGMLAKSSGTAERLASFVAPFGNLPFASTIKAIARNLEERAAMQPLLPARSNLLPAAAAASGASARERDQSRGGQRPY